MEKVWRLVQRWMVLVYGLGASWIITGERNGLAGERQIDRVGDLI